MFGVQVSTDKLVGLVLLASALVLAIVNFVGPVQSTLSAITGILQ